MATEGPAKEAGIAVSPRRIVGGVLFGLSVFGHLSVAISFAQAWSDHFSDGVWWIRVPLGFVCAYVFLSLATFVFPKGRARRVLRWVMLIELVFFLVAITFIVILGMFLASFYPG